MNPNWKNTPLPAYMKDIPKDPRGYPIPFVVFGGKDKTYFQVNDSQKIEYVLEHDLCAICGKKLGADKWLVGGPGSAFHPHGAYIDTPTHYQCLEYALQVCPYLAAPNYTKRIDASNIKPEDKVDNLLFQDPTSDPSRVPFFVAIHITGFTVTRPGVNQRYLIANKDYLAVEFWNDGIKLDKDTVMKLLNQ